jgi:segregation and condensation protein B
MDQEKLIPILEALIMASGSPLSVERMQAVFDEKERPDKKLLRKALDKLAASYQQTSVELKEVSSGYRFQVRKEYSDWTSKLWEEKPARYSRALLETLALVAYKQPITRGEIEKIRGVNVSTQIMKTLLEREWVSIVGHRDVPGKPAIYATTKQFLDYFNLKSLDELPPLAEIRDIDKINGELDLPDPNLQAGSTETVDTEAESTDAEGKEPVVNLGVDDGEEPEVADAMTAEQ